MEIVKGLDRRGGAPLKGVKIYEYDMAEPALSFGIAEIEGRYPARGFVMNRGVKELVYIAKGAGQIIRPKGATDLAEGDAVLIDRGEVYAWEGRMVLHMTTTPRFDPAQHVLVE